MVRSVFACVVISSGLSLVAAQGQKTTWDKVYTAEQASRGEKLYAENCAACHGEALGGVEMAPPLAGDPVLVRSISLADLNCPRHRYRS